MTDNLTRKAYRDPAKTGTQQHRGRFQPGQSGNPKGRPVGSRHKATLAALALLEGDLEVITTKLIEKAKAGEQWAITLVMNKLIPNDLPPVVVPSFKLELGSSQARDPGGA
jgi:hypothetical protein